jgi:hypothetical protein
VPLQTPHRYHGPGLSDRLGGGRVAGTAPGYRFPPTPAQGQCAADGLTSALLHCSSFRYFHSPRRVLCTFRSPYLCNIGCRADRGGPLRDTPKGSGCRFKQPYTGGGSKAQGTPSGATTGRANAIQWDRRPQSGSESPSMLLHRHSFPEGEEGPAGVPAPRAPKRLRKVKRVGVAHEGDVPKASTRHSPPAPKPRRDHGRESLGTDTPLLSRPT